MMRAKGTILIVDDNEAILTSLKILLHDVFAHVCTTPHPHTIVLFFFILFCVRFSTNIYAKTVPKR